MADEQKQSFWKSLPGILTAATGFVAALSGLVAGLSQLGVFRREPPPIAPVTATAPAPAPESTSTGGTPPGATPSAAAPSAAAPSAAAPRPAPAPAPAPRTITPVDSAPAAPRLAKGATLELSVPVRTCAPADGPRRFTARLVSPVKAGGATVLPAGTTAVLHLRRGESSVAPAVRLDSLVRPDLAAAVPSATVRVRRGAASAACLRADARLSATLDAAVTLRRR